MKKMKKSIIFLLIIILIYFILSSNPLVWIMALSEGITNIDSIESSPPGWGGVHFIVLGKDFEGREKGIWVRSKKYIFFTDVVYSEYLDNRITEDDVFMILKESNAPENLSNLDLLFAPGDSQSKYNKEDTIFWVVLNEERNFNKEYAIIDFYSGDVLEIAESRIKRGK